MGVGDEESHDSWAARFVTAACTRREYAFDANTNRTGLTTTPGTALAIPTATALCDLTGATPVTVTSTYDTADRATGTGYTYDTLARTTALPASAVNGGSPLTVGYAANDMVATLTQAGRTKTYTLDPARRILTTADTAGPTLTNHYTAGDDNPVWIGSSDGTWTRYLNAPAGGLALTVDNTGAVLLNIANLHGDIVATAAPTDTGPATYSETTEYGLPRDPTAPARRYGWLGTHHRNTGDTLAHLTLMGVRLYNPTTGRFLSVDPVTGGSCNDYDYVCADPINGLDLDGKRCWTCAARSAGRWVARHRWDIALTAASFAPGLGQAAWAYRGYRAYRRYRAYRGFRTTRYASRSCRSNSFMPGTGVLMADGTSRDIDDIAIGDLVLAADPDTGEARAEPVTDLITRSGEKDLITITADPTMTAGPISWSPRLVIRSTPKPDGAKRVQ